MICAILWFRCVAPGCDSEFSRRQHLEQHVALHTKADEFPCDSCKKVFYHEVSLKKHRKLHETAAVVLRCPECGEGVRRGKRGLRSGVGFTLLFMTPTLFHLTRC